jgi:serine/threonine protein kinase
VVTHIERHGYMREAMTMVQLPERIGRYRVVDLLDSGTSADLYRVRDEVLGRQVALKLFHGSLPTDDPLNSSIRDIVEGAGLHHPNIARTFDIGSHEGHLYVLTEYLVGRSLKTVLETRSPWLSAKVLDVLEQVCAALVYAHGRGVVHGSVEPAHIFIVDPLTVKLLGLEDDQLLRRTGTTRLTLGRQNYWAPEQFMGKAPDARTDVFAVGMVFYELMTGQLPFAAADVSTSHDRVVLSQSPAALDRLVPGLDPALVALIHRCLEPRPEDRFQDMLSVEQQVTEIRRQTSRRDESRPSGLVSVSGGRWLRTLSKALRVPHH